MKKLYKEIKEDFVQNAIVKWLSKHDWRIMHLATLSGRGVDIKAKHNKYGRYYLIEAKGAKDGSSEEVAFVYSLGQIITRMNTSGRTRYYYGLGLPKGAADKAIRRIPHQIAMKLLLHIFSVDEKGNVFRYMPKDLKKLQMK